MTAHCPIGEISLPLGEGSLGPGTPGQGGAVTDEGYGSHGDVTQGHLHVREEGGGCQGVCPRIHV